MTNTRVQVITSVQRRRRWTREEKERLVAAAMEPGAVASAVAREAGIHVSQLFRWRQELCGPAAKSVRFAEATITAEPSSAPAAAPPAMTPGGSIEVEFTAAPRLRITGPVDPTTLSAVIDALAKFGRR
ncbi:IS66-like element accessory protein TnpA [Rhodovulum sp. PH10]|uniref:IS66-like element accessory protein TnpA n=1 Tax=Rhodovulum sp. PH10 TaxID=1187851 RepID=UPI00058D47BC|nr:transposase [Rhodovulum sp. PH10]